MRTLVAAALLALSAASAGAQSFDAPPSAVRSALDHLGAQREALGLKAGDLSDLDVSSAHRDARSGLVHVYVQQKIDGIDIVEAIVSVAVDSKDDVVHASGDLISGTRSAAKGMSLSASDALDRASALAGERPLRARALGVASGAERRTSFGTVAETEVVARLVYVPTKSDGLRLAWDVTLPTRDSQHIWVYRLDAQTGDLLSRHDMVIHDTFSAPEASGVESRVPFAPRNRAVSPAMAERLAGSYLVYPMPIEAPIYAASRTAVTNPDNAVASPFGWHDTNGASGAEYTITRGNNVHAYQDRNNSNSSSGDEPDGGASLTFAPALDLTQDPSTYQDAAVVNLFYWNNIIHDVMVQYGFDAASGNFQQNNYGAGGNGGDYVQAQAQDAAEGSGNCNANMSTPTDGGRPRMQMYLCDDANPERDGDFDNGVIVHEYGHGISIRLTGGAATSSCLNNAEQMGEGWSDYYGLMLTLKAGDTRAQARPIGNYLVGQGTGGNGIRNAPYSTDFGVNNYTYQRTRSGVSVPHGIGFVWSTILWEVTWDMIDAHGFSADIYNASGTAGNQMMMALVTQGLKLQPCSPGFVDGRDAILAADALLYPDPNNAGRGLHYTTLWQGFARRGLGASASQGSTSSNSDNTEAFDTPLPPPEASVSASSVSASLAMGQTGTESLTLSNVAPSGHNNLTYTASVRNATQPFQAAVSAPEAERLAPSGRLTVPGMSLKGSDLADGAGTVSKLAGGPDGFGYVFTASGEAGGPAVNFTDISGSGTALSLGDDASRSVSLPFGFPFYGAVQSSVDISSNGYLTFGGPATVYSNTAIPSGSTTNHAIYAFWDDLNPNAGGTVYHRNMGDGRFIVQYDDVVRYGTSTPETFQVILFDDGDIEIQYGSMSGVLNSATVGIENAAGNDGLQVVYNSAYVTSDKAVRFGAPATWVTAAPAAGSIAPGASSDLTLSFDASGLPDGVYTADLVIESNDPTASPTTVAVTLNVGGTAPPSGPIVVTSPLDGATVAAGETFDITWDVGGVDPSTSVKIQYKKPGQRGLTVERSVPNTGSYSWNVPANLDASDDSFLFLFYTDAVDGKTRVRSGVFAVTNDGGTTPPSTRPIAITSPSGGAFAAGSTVQVQWDPGTVDASTPIRIVHKQNGERANTITRSTPNDGSFDWEVPATLASSSEYRLQFQYADESGRTVRVWSDYFEITGSALLAGASGAEMKAGGLELALEPVRPNPVRGSAGVSFTMAEAGDVLITVHDVRGREVAELARGTHDAGRHAATWNAGDAAPGVYVIRLQTAGKVLVQRAIVVR